MEQQVTDLAFALDTFYFLVCGALVMWMAAGFAMLEAGLVRAKNTTEILTKNVALFAIACTMFAISGYQLMYGNYGWGLSNLGDDFGNAYSNASDFFFQVVFVATAMSIVSGAVAEPMKLWAFLLFGILILPKNKTPFASNLNLIFQFAYLQGGRGTLDCKLQWYSK